jgi:RimJ/RimL family protein N-acetyltransferase
MNEDAKNKSIWRGKKVLLRAKTAVDIPRYLADGLADDMRLYGDGYVVYPASEDVMRDNQENALGYSKDETCSLAIATLDGELVGAINSTDCNPQSGTFSYGISIFSEFRRCGYALDAVRILLRYYFEERRYHRAGATVYGFNEPSITLQEELGFQLEGRQREMIFTKGKRHDVLLFGITADEFWAKWGKSS